MASRRRQSAFSLIELVMVIAILGVIHYWWLVKKDITEPVIYALVLAFLLGARVWYARRRQRSVQAMTLQEGIS